MTSSSNTDRLREAARHLHFLNVGKGWPCDPAMRCPVCSAADVVDVEAREIRETPALPAPKPRKPSGRYRSDWLPSWPAYAQQQGLALPDNGRVEQRMVCTIHGGERDNLCVNIRTGAWHCKSCLAHGGDVLAHYRALHGSTFIEAAKALGAWEGDDADRRPAPAAPPPRRVAAPEPDDDRTERWKLDAIARIWRQSRQLDGIAAEYIVDVRHGVLPPADSDLRWLPHLELLGFSGPVLVGRGSPAEDYRRTRCMHLTGLAREGGTWRRTQRRYLGPKKGCVIRLWPDECVTTGLAIAEGIETALALAHAYRPTWACMDAGNLAEFPVLAGIESLVIAADHDDAGIKAAEACGQRWADAGRDVEIVLPPTPKQDIADVAMGAA